MQYKLVLARTPGELDVAAQAALDGNDDGQGGAIWTQDDNPELGQFELRQSSDSDPVTSTITDGLEPGVEYRALLLSYDTQGCVSRSQVAVGRTEAAPLVELTYFDEVASAVGKPRPEGVATFESDTGRAYSGSDYVSWLGLPTGPTPLYENIGIAALFSLPEVDYPSLDISSGYVEIAVAVDGVSVAAWGEGRVVMGPAPGVCTSVEAASIKPLALRAGKYQLLQLPLREFSFHEQPLTEATLKERGICEVSVGRSWVTGETVRVDAIQIKW